MVSTTDMQTFYAKYIGKTEIQSKSPCIFIMKEINLNDGFYWTYAITLQMQNNELLMLLIHPFQLQLRCISLFSHAHAHCKILSRIS